MKLLLAGILDLPSPAGGTDGGEVRKCINLFQDNAPGKPDITYRLNVLINKAAADNSRRRLIRYQFSVEEFFCQ